MISHGLKRSKTCRVNINRYPFLYLIQNRQLIFRNSTSQVKTLFPARPAGRFIEKKCNLKRKETPKTNSNRDNLRGPITLRTKRQLKHLKIWFFIKARTINFHKNSTKCIPLIKWNQLSFPRTEIDKLFLTPVRSVS